MDDTATLKKIPNLLKIQQFARNQYVMRVAPSKEAYQEHLELMEYLEILSELDLSDSSVVGSSALEIYESACEYYDNLKSLEKPPAHSALNYDFFRINVYPKMKDLNIKLEECTPREKTLLFDEILFRLTTSLVSPGVLEVYMQNRKK